MFSYFKKKQQEAKEHKIEKIQPSFSTLEDNLSFIRESLNHTDDLVVQAISLNEKKGNVLYLRTMVDTEYFQSFFWIPLTEGDEMQIANVLASPECSQTKNLIDIEKNILNGYCVIFFEGETDCIMFSCVQANNRSPDEPENEKAIRGSHKGFVENLDLNLNSIRDRIKNRQLTIKYFTKGTEANTNIAIIYMSDIANPATVKEVEKRIEAISSDMVFSPGFIEESLEDAPFSPFPQVLTTERPDRVKANLMEGRIAIMTAGSTDASIVPVTFFSFFQSPDDYNIRFYAGTFFRLLRLFSFLGVIILPATYVALVGFHFEIIPQELVTLVKSSIENVPVSPFIEAIAMSITIELIREAGIRLPTPIAQTIGIVGGLIIGDAVVNAGLVSNIMIIVVALTAIMSFSIPSYEMGNVLRILGLPVMIGAATLGFVGIVFALMIIAIHMCTLQSFGTPYIAPLSPLHFNNLKDAIIRAPNWMMKERPVEVEPQKLFRQKNARKWDTHDK